MKFNLNKLKFNIWFYFLLFAIIMLIIQWVTQVTFLENNYIKKQERKLTAVSESMILSLESGKLVDFQNEKFEANDRYGYTVILANGTKSSSDDAVENDYYSKYYQLFVDCYSKLNQQKYFCSRMNGAEGEDELLVYSTIISVGDSDESRLFVVYLPLSVINDALIVIQTQLVYVSLILIFVAFFIALYISSRIARPLTEMSETAKLLAKGDYSVTFSGEGYEEIRELSETLNYAKEELAKTGTLQRDLMANVTHDLKTPLTMVKAYAEMIMDLSGDIKAKRDKHATVIINEADRLTMLVNDILDLSKLQTEIGDLKIERTNLSELTRAVLTQFESFFEKEGFAVNASIESGLYANVDRKRIEQVVYNLIGNAVNYTGDDKSIEVSLKRYNNKILLEVVDTGKGISEEKIKTIWDKYYRSSETHKRPVKGTGLGLSIVKAILENHRLKYGVISKEGIGSNFFVEFEVSNEEK